MMINKNTTLKEIYNISKLTDIKDCLISGGNFFEGESAEMTLEQLHEKNPTWATNDMIFGLERLLKSEFQVFPLYKNESEKRIKNHSRNLIMTVIKNEPTHFDKIFESVNISFAEFAFSPFSTGTLSPVKTD